MKIAFFFVCVYENRGIPIGLSYLIPILKNRGHEVSVFETTFYNFDYSSFNLTGVIDETGKQIISDFKAFLNQNKPDLIAVSCSSLTLNFPIAILESLEKRYITVYGGVGVTVDYENVIQHELVDYACVGFGEQCLVGLIEYLEGRQELRSIPNLVYKQSGVTIKNEFVQSFDLSSLPMPDWSLFDKRNLERIFKGKIKRWGNFQLTRGCPFDCAYCINGYLHRELKMKVYKFPYKKIIEEIKFLSKRYNLEIVRILDECFGFGNIQYFKDFAATYKKEVGLPTIIETRPETITSETIEILKAMNCISVSLGIEVGSETQRKTVLHRTVSNKTTENAFTLLHKAKIRSSSFNIMGFPDDTREKIRETIELNRKCKPEYVNIYFFLPAPGTKLRKYCLENNLLETTAIVDYSLRSVIKNRNLGHEELLGLYRTFKYYIRFPRWLFPLIKLGEKPSRLGKTVLWFLSFFYAP